jgi:acetyl-CoA synthetase
VSAEEFVWVPSEEVKRDSRLGEFLGRHGLPDYPALHRRAAEDPEWFWNAVVEYFGIRFEQPYERVLDISAGIPWAKWCVGGRTNLVLNCLDAHVGTPTSARTAIIWEGEDGEIRRWTYDELNAATCALAGGLRHLGVRRGEVVALYTPMIPEAAAAFLAIAKIGAIVLPMFSGFGAAAAAGRLRSSDAVAVITVDGTRRRGREVALKSVIDEAVSETPSVRNVVVLDLLGIDLGWHDGRDVMWRDIATGTPDTVPTEIVDAEHPVMLMYTSGTTGPPKGTIHTHCGSLVKNALDMGLCIDLGADDRLLWMSDMGWVVGPKIVISTTMMGGTMILADGAPDYPEPDRLWRMAADHGATMLGIAATVVRTMMKHGVGRVEAHDLSRLRLTLSVGEPWNTEAWMWFFEHVCGRRIPILNYSGGTEIGGAILTGTLHDPLKPCAFGGGVPGHGVAVLDENGNDIAPGEVGELALRQPSIGLTRGLWRDPDRYIEAYWSRFENTWVHGDWASIDEDGLWYIHGRSDDTIKIAGKRTGPAEIEAILIETGDAVEAAAVGIPDPIKGESVACVCVPTESNASTKSLEDAVVHGLGRPFRPSRVIFVSQLPKTRNQKIMRRLVRAVFTGDPPGDLSSLVNPDALEELRRAVNEEKDS